VGTVVGVGIFGLPYVASKSGILIMFFYFLGVGIVAFFIDLAFGKVACETSSIHRLPGYVEIYLGKKWKILSLVSTFLGLTGALLAYLIIGGEFLRNVFPFLGENNFFSTILFFTIGSYFIFKGIKQISLIELLFSLSFLIVVCFLFLKGLPFFNLEYFKTTNLQNIFFPYGVVLFSLWGSAIVPEIAEMTKRDKKSLKKVIGWGIFLSGLIYLIFVLTVVGVCGWNTSKDALSGLAKALGKGVVMVGFVLGILTCFTSFLTIGLTLKKILWYDVGISKNISWAITCFFPLFLFLIGCTHFIKVISLTGALSIGTEGIIIVFLYKEFLKTKFSSKINPFYIFLSIVFLLGVFFEIFYFKNI